ncbi:MULTISPECIES: ATP-dependent DNA helicase DinG [Bacillus]|uniref:ATP-dependent DNA helicase DinG n=1 Tax=Bacillus TaxID=1386 RepID=UPI00084A64AD|nr:MULTISPECIES: ATP-dependent DNA helicase DinG [Bacillus]MEC0280138.1 ATP-dependent DNA helicase DinG [Bacillus halotolerans]OEC78375.1 ATP-dependent helicase DinG [Bacillus halotolerans]UZD49849.1 ATP-dependent DNA helicase DinG [Bacillus halotolerans]WEY43507.1 ATP-dependent DNA helicase DinG [Bacillus sp. B28]
MKKQRFVVIDVETTGNSPKKGDKIIQIAAVVIENGQITERFSKYINPNKSIPVFIEQLTGITNQMVENQPPFKAVAEEVFHLLDGAYFVAHNIHFDLGFVKHELHKAGFQLPDCEVLDTVELSRIAFPGFEGYKLTELSEELQLRHDQPHRADSDAEVTGLIFLEILEKLRRLPYPTLKQLRRLSQHFISDLTHLLDMFIYENRHTDMPGFTRFSSFSVREPEPVIERRKEDEEFLFEMENWAAGNEKALSEFMPQYEKREGQMLMMKEVADAFANREHALIEAAPGIGKTIGYLIPAALFAKKSKKPVVISTYSTLLQQQILTKDLPIVKDMFPFSVTAAILKGQSHYLCLYKFEQVLHEEDDNYDAVLTKAQLLVWLTETNTGDVAELNLPSGGKLLWDRLAYDDHSYKRHQRDQVIGFYERAKQSAMRSDLVITNHSLLLTDEASRKKRLPDSGTFVIDEAHHFERAASEHLGKRATYIELHTKLSRIGTLKEQGLLKKMRQLFQRHSLPVDSFFEVEEWIQHIQAESDAFFSSVHSFVKRRKPKEDLNRLVFNVNKKSHDKGWPILTDGAERLCSMLAHLQQLFETQTALMEEHLTAMKSKNAFLADEYNRSMNDLGEYCQTLNQLFFGSDDNEAVWIEIDAKGAKNAVAIYAQPLEPGELLADQFFARKNSVVLTSATLTIENSFHFIIERLGLSDFFPRTMRIASPFSYDERMQVMIPKEIKSIQDTGQTEFIQDTARYIELMAKEKQPKILVLFTSHDMLKKVHQELKLAMSVSGIQLLAQGITGGSPGKLMKTFKTANQAILLGTNHFWEGVDFPGDELTTVIIVRLPFRAPDHPLHAAKCELARKKGRNPFQTVSLPEAVLTFRQGIGRLLRTAGDKGTIVILDRRVKTAGYGRLFLDALPTTAISEVTDSEIEAYVAGKSE